MSSTPEQPLATGGKVWTLPVPKTTDNGLTKLSVNINQETAAALREIAANNGITITEAIRRAVSIADFVYKEKAKGRRIQTMSKRGYKVREIELR